MKNKKRLINKQNKMSELLMAVKNFIYDG